MTMDDSQRGGREGADHSFAFGGKDNFQLEELSQEELENQVASGIFYKVEDHKEHFALHPFWLSTLRQGINEELKKTLGKWNSRLEAYVVGFEDVKSDTTSAAINEDHKWIHIDILVTFYLYKPEDGQVLNGIIRKIGHKASICTLFNVFSATVFAESKEELSTWSIGDELSFEIYFIQNRRKGPIIRAQSKGHTPSTKSRTFLEPESWEDQDDEQVELPKRSSPKKGKNTSTSTVVNALEETWADEEEEIELAKRLSSQKIRKKKDKSSEWNDTEMEIENDTSIPDFDDSSIVPKSKKKKSRKSDISFEESFMDETDATPKTKKKNHKNKERDNADFIIMKQDIPEIESPVRKKHKKSRKSE